MYEKHRLVIRFVTSFLVSFLSVKSEEVLNLQVCKLKFLKILDTGQKENNLTRQTVKIPGLLSLFPRREREKLWINHLRIIIIITIIIIGVLCQHDTHTKGAPMYVCKHVSFLRLHFRRTLLQ